MGVDTVAVIFSQLNTTFSPGGVNMALQIIGAGLGRTGTASTKLAIEQLGLGRCYHMGEVIANPSHMAYWIAAADGKPEWGTLLAGYVATTDYPACTFWRELSEYFPEAKVMLTVRDAEKWFESVNETIMSQKMIEYVKDTPFGALNQRTIWDTVEGRMADRDYMIAHFERHAAEVKATIPADRLLVFDVKQGWEPLCAFLGVPVPKGPFPRVNSRNETRAMFEAMMSASPAAGLESRLDAAAREMFGKRSR